MSLISSQQNDEWCRKCQDYADDLDDFKSNFVCCGACPQSYHQSCLPKQFQKKRSWCTCNDIINNNNENNNDNSHVYGCCDFKREIKKIYSWMNKPYQSLHFTYKYDNNTKNKKYMFVETVDQDNIAEIESKIKNKGKLYLRDTYRSIKYKGITFSIGDNISINTNDDPQYPETIAMIQELCQDEDDSVPQVHVFWYWYQTEVIKDIQSKHINLKLKEKCLNPKYISDHLYLGFDNEDWISMDSINGKVVIKNNITEFESELNNLHDSCVYFCESIYLAQENRFESFNLIEFQKRQHLEIDKTNKLQEKHNKIMRQHRQKKEKKMVKMQDKKMKLKYGINISKNKFKNEKLIKYEMVSNANKIKDYNDENDCDYYNIFDDKKCKQTKKRKKKTKKKNKKKRKRKVIEIESSSDENEEERNYNLNIQNILNLNQPVLKKRKLTVNITSANNNNDYCHDDKNKKVNYTKTDPLYLIGDYKQAVLAEKEVVSTTNNEVQSVLQDLLFG